MFNRHVGGNGRKYGNVPKYMLARGLNQHPLLDLYYQDPRYLSAPCGIIAFLMYVEPKYKKTQNIERLLQDANTYRELIGLESQYMRNEDFDKLLVSFDKWRVIIFTADVKIEYMAQGENWEKSSDRTEPDPYSVYIYRDVHQKHYWWIEFIKSFVGKMGHEVCYVCFYKSKGKSNFQEHLCNPVFFHYQCEVCKSSFSSKQSLDFHFSRTTTISDCECCGKTKFYGLDCFDRHMRENCLPPKGFDKEICNDCERFFVKGKEHKCQFKWCYYCQYEYENFEDYKSHRCYLETKERFWDPTPEGKFICHFGYDFETCREDIPHDDDIETYKHEVMAWCVQLMIPCDETKRYVLEKNFREEIQRKIIDSELPIFSVLLPAKNSIRIWGKKLVTFMHLVTNILVQSKRKGQDQWEPYLWAHNGSKFDSKFVLDYFLNTEKLDLVGTRYEEEFTEESRTKDGQIKFRKIKKNGRPPTNNILVTMVGSKVLEMKVKGVQFRCSYAHHAAPLRDLPARFDLSVETKKGEFPYPLLKEENWGRVFPTFPSLDLYGIDSMSSSRRTQVLEWYNQQPKNYPWSFDDQLWEYLFADVNVLCEVMEAYHEKAEEMHKTLWKKYSERLDKVTSPLLCPTLASWALLMYQSWFMPEKQLAILRPNEAALVREGLRGGRTDKLANYMDLEHPDDKIVYVDFKSLYPSVQRCNVHDTYYPVGAPFWAGNEMKGYTDNEKLIRDIGDKTGFVRISCRPKKYVTHPTLHRKGTSGDGKDGVKLLFENDPKNDQVYGWPEVLEAIRCDEIEITWLEEALLFDKGTNVFKEYVDFFFDLKEKAEEDGNEGLRQLAKLLLNSLWGKLGQKSYGEKEWVYDITRRDYLMQKFESGEYEMTSCILPDDRRAFFTYKVPCDKANLRTTAPHIAAFVSMWGRVILHKKLLEPHGMRALYCDTDSAIVYLRHGKDTMRYLGNGLGDLTDEVKKMAPKKFKEPFITEVITILPKTYSLKIKDKLDPDLVYEKVVCKGFEPSYSNEQQINFDSYKELVFTEYDLNAWFNGKRPLERERDSIDSAPRLTFKSSIHNNELVPRESQVQKKLNGKYTKAQVHPDDPRFIIPFSSISKLGPPKGTFLSDRDKHFE